MYEQNISSRVEKRMDFLSRRNRMMYCAIKDKIAEILENPHRYKNLRSPKQHLKRVHFRPFVLTFSVDEKNKTVIFEDFDHHDNIYDK